MTAPGSSDINLMQLTQLAEVRGQLTAMQQLIQQHHDSSSRRIDDFRAEVHTRMGGMDKRLETLEHNERGTALRTAGVSALTSLTTSAIVAAVLKVLGRP